MSGYGPENANETSLLFNPVGLDRTYGVIFDVVNGEKTFCVNYEIEVRYTGKLNDYYLLFELRRKEMFINHKLPETLIDQFAAGCGEIIYPLEVISGTFGEFMGINNKKAILERWTRRKKELGRYYIGEKSEEILGQMDLALSSDRHLVASVFSDQFIALYFSKAYSFTKKQGQKEFETFIPVVPYTAAVKYTITQHTDRSVADNGTIQLFQKGHCSDPRSMEDIAKRMPVPVSGQLSQVHSPLKGDLELNYSLYAKDNTINSLTGNFSLSGTVADRSVKVQVYHLREKDSVITKDTAEEQPGEKKRRGFFSFFD
ncbi:MAG TPA: hypothetical protein VGC08_08015 [Pedobacter sp.]